MIRVNLEFDSRRQREMRCRRREERQLRFAAAKAIRRYAKIGTVPIMLGGLDEWAKRYPWRVARWIIKTAHMSQEETTRRIMRALVR